MISTADCIVESVDNQEELSGRIETWEETVQNNTGGNTGRTVSVVYNNSNTYEDNGRVVIPYDRTIRRSNRNSRANNHIIQWASVTQFLSHLSHLSHICYMTLYHGM